MQKEDDFMNRKLTLLLDETIINQAKEYAKNKNETLSGIVEKYFTFITRTNPKSSLNISREIEKLSGIIHIPAGFDTKEEYRKYRSERLLNE